MSHIGDTAEMVSNSICAKHTDMKVVAHDAFLLGWSFGKTVAVDCLKKQYLGCQKGTLVSYAIAADVLKLDMEEFEK